MFRKLDEVAAYASMTREERDLYDSQVKAVRDRKGQLEYAEMEGMAKGMAKDRAKDRAKGFAEGRAEVIVNMASQGLAYEMIAKFTGLPLETVKKMYSVTTDRPENKDINKKGRAALPLPSLFY